LDNYPGFYLQPINLEKDIIVKIPNPELGESKDSLGIALVLLMLETEPILHYNNLKPVIEWKSNLLISRCGRKANPCHC
jgi:hypothetical protein